MSEDKDGDQRLVEIEAARRLGVEEGRLQVQQELERQAEEEARLKAKNEAEDARAMEVEHYTQTVAAWYTTNLERDKNLLALSAAGIGVLVTLQSTLGIRSAPSFLLYLGAMLSFLACAGTVLWVLKQNAVHLQDVVHKRAQSDPLLGFLDRSANVSFMAGVACSALLGLLAALHSATEGEKMNSIEKLQGQLGEQQVQIEELRRSFNNAEALRPAPALPPAPAPAAPAVPAPPTSGKK